MSLPAMAGVRRKRMRAPRSPRRYLLSPSRAAAYAIAVAALVLLASVNDLGGALALGLFAGLCYARLNMLLVAPAYVLSVIAFAPSVWTLVYVAVPVAVFMLSRLAGADDTVNKINTVLIGMPVASYGTMFCLKYGRDEGEMVRGTLITTILSVVTIPLLTFILF